MATRQRAVTVRLPEVVAEAIEAEAARSIREPREVVRDLLLRMLPRYVAEVLAEDLRTGDPIDARGVQETQR